MSDVSYRDQREAMIHTIAEHALTSGRQTGRPVISDTVNAAMMEVPRHNFVPEVVREYAYSDQPLPIGHEKTISQPFIVALMVDLLEIEPDDRVLELGTGLGYQAAVLSRLARQVYTIDIISELAVEATAILESLEYDNVEVRIGNGQAGLPDLAPFDKIIVASSADQIPQPLIDQLRVGGRMTIPVGPDEFQDLVLLEKDDSGIDITKILPVRFSRMVIVH